jgi:cytolysin (calcineurin-like family phosphatase)
MKPIIPLILAGLLAVTAAARDLTFLSTSDSHYRETDHRQGHHNELIRASVVEMNRLSQESWPEELGGGPIAKPAGLLMPGDLIDDGDHVRNGRNVTREQFGMFVRDFGLDGTDGLLKMPVFEGFGNHDGPPVGQEKHGFSTQGMIVERNRIRKEKGLIQQVSANGLHYSWDWQGVHFVQLNIYPADRQHASVRYSPVWHDPQDALAFLKQDLAETVGESGRPVVLAAHCGFDTNWWCAEDWRAFHQAVAPYRVVLYLFGHTGTGIGAWAPDEGARPIPWINDGHTDVGFFVIRITDDRLRAAYRVKTGLTVTKGPDGRKSHTWDGGWGWKWLLDRPLDPPPAGR